MEQHVNTLLTVYGEDLTCLRNRIGKDRSKHTFRAMKMGRDYVEKFLKEHYGQEDISIERLTTQFIQEFSIWLSADKGLPKTSVLGNISRKKNSNDSLPIILTNHNSAMRVTSSCSLPLQDYHIST